MQNCDNKAQQPFPIWDVPLTSKKESQNGLYKISEKSQHSGAQAATYFKESFSKYNTKFTKGQTNRIQTEIWCFFQHG